MNAMAETEETLRILAYSPDSYGLGHVRRTVSLARAFLNRVPRSSVLLLTGAPRAHYFEYPPHCDYLKLPSVTKNREGEYICRDLDFSLDQTIRLRGNLIRVAAESYEPDVLLVDHSPLGICGEILPTLRLRGHGPRRALRVLGMRDVIDDPERVRASWDAQGIIDVLRECYDAILVYGQRDVFDPIKAYGIPPDVARKMTFVGYISRDGLRSQTTSLKRRYAPRTGRLVLVTLGGGGDGNTLLRSFLDGHEQLGDAPPFEVLAVTGPLMSPRKRRRFQDRARGRPGITLLEFTETLPALMEAADLVVSMGGYNTVCELASAGARALIVPRSFPRREQLVRARLLAARGVVRCLEDQDPAPQVLMGQVLERLEERRPKRGWGLRFSGLSRSAETLERLVHQARDSNDRPCRSSSSESARIPGG